MPLGYFALGASILNGPPCPARAWAVSVSMSCCLATSRPRVPTVRCASRLLGRGEFGKYLRVGSGGLNMTSSATETRCRNLVPLSGRPSHSTGTRRDDREADHVSAYQTPDHTQRPTAHTATVDEHLERIHWHLIRGDHLRAGVASRAGAVLSTNTITIAGLALIFSLRSQKPTITVIVIAMAALSCVVLSVSNAVLALMTIRGGWHQFGSRGMGSAFLSGSAFLYCYAEIAETSATFEDFKRKVTTISPEELLEFALVDLWRCACLHGYRYQKLRIAMRWLLAALVMFLAATVASAFR